MTLTFALSSAAEADLRRIVRYSRNRWGEAQTRTYLGKLHKGIERLAAAEPPFKNLDTLFPSLRAARCASHYVFCLGRASEPALIVAILHQNMDLITRLAERLDLPDAEDKFS